MGVFFLLASFLSESVNGAALQVFCACATPFASLRASALFVEIYVLDLMIVLSTIRVF